MKKIIAALCLVVLLVVLIGADFRRKYSPPVIEEVPKKKCLGYTIIEFGKGIDCNGDTVRLNKVKGGQVLAVDHKNTSATLQLADR